MGFAVAQGMKKGLIFRADSPVLLVTTPVIDGPIEEDAIDLGPINESPVSKPGEDLSKQKAVASTPLENVLKHLLVQFLH